jgi:hypothetical protein
MLFKSLVIVLDQEEGILDVQLPFFKGWKDVMKGI